MRVWRAPGGYGPYGITVTPRGDVYYASLAGSHIARIDVAHRRGDTHRAADARPGRAPGLVGLSRPDLGERVECGPARPSTTRRPQRWREWKLPGADAAGLRGLRRRRDVVWVTDFGGNALVRFDSRAERFTVFRLRTADAAVRQLLGRRARSGVPSPGSTGWSSCERASGRTARTRRARACTQPRPPCGCTAGRCR